MTIQHIPHDLTIGSFFYLANSPTIRACFEPEDEQLKTKSEQIATAITNMNTNNFMKFTGSRYFREYFKNFILIEQDKYSNTQ